MGPAPAPLFVLRGKYRYRLLARATRSVPMQQMLASWLAGVKVPPGVRVKVDIDPYSFL
jgi:primosomal protein N' (replication factor Y)